MEGESKVWEDCDTASTLPDCDQIRTQIDTLDSSVIAICVQNSSVLFYDISYGGYDVFNYLACVHIHMRKVQIIRCWYLSTHK